MAFVLGHSARAGTDTWTGNTSPNWSVVDGFNTVPSSGDTLVFGAAGAAGTTLNNDLFTSASSTVTGPSGTGAIVFNAGAPAYTINGGAFQLGTSMFQGDGNIYNNSSNVQTINSNLTSLAYNFNAKAGTVAFGGTNTVQNVDINGGATMIVTGTTTTDVGNTGGTYAGTPIIGDGGNGAGTLTVAATGTLNVNGSPDNDGTMLIGQSGPAGTLNLNGGAINVAARAGVAIGNSNGIGTLNINAGTMTVGRVCLYLRAQRRGQHADLESEWRHPGHGPGVRHGQLGSGQFCAQRRHATGASRSNELDCHRDRRDGGKYFHLHHRCQQLRGDHRQQHQWDGWAQSDGQQRHQGGSRDLQRYEHLWRRDDGERRHLVDQRQQQRGDRQCLGGQRHHNRR